MEKRTVSGLVTLLVALATSAGAIDGALAQTYPTAPIRMVVGFPPGGVADVLARIIGPKLADGLGQPVVVENRPGAGSNIAAEVVARAAPDGYTLFVFSTVNAVNVSLYSKLSYDPVNDFAPVSLLASMANLLVVHPSVPAQSVRELIALAKSKPGQLNFGSAGNGSTQHISAQLFLMMAQLDMVHVPYKGSVPAMTALLAGEIPLMFNVISTALPHVKAGKVRALAITTARRSSLVPELPTVAEAGLPGFEYVAHFGLQAPARTPKEIIAKLNGETTRILQMADVRERFAVNGAEPMHSTPEQFGAFIREEIEKHRPLIKATGARAD
jgi:tripartite-type tricarboxylate transporter receptor subunit TctC